MTNANKYFNKNRYVFYLCIYTLSKFFQRYDVKCQFLELWQHCTTVHRSRDKSTHLISDRSNKYQEKLDNIFLIRSDSLTDMSRVLIQTPKMCTVNVCSTTFKTYSNFPLHQKSNLQLANQSKPSFLNRKRFLSKNTCWKCGIEKKSLNLVFCERCNIVQNPYEKNNFFRIFELDEQFSIDQQVLRDKYRKLQNALHPDRFTNKSEEEKNISAEYSSLVNKAYNSLLTPMNRAEHLLKLKGETITENQKLDDPEFLMEMMELNEEVENAEPKKLQELNLKNKNTLEKLTIEIDKCFKNDDIEKAKEIMVKMKYYHSLSNRINSILRELGIVD